ELRKLDEIAPGGREVGDRAESVEDPPALLRYRFTGDAGGEVRRGDPDAKGRPDLRAGGGADDHLGIARIPPRALLERGEHPCVERPSPEPTGPEDEPDPGHTRTQHTQVDADVTLPFRRPGVVPGPAQAGTRPALQISPGS